MDHYIPIDGLNPEVWGPHYWFFLHTVAQTYPDKPTAVTKRKYYDLIQNMPLFIPNAKIGDTFSQLLDNFPLSPYLDSRDSFVRWVHFMHNKINVLLNKEEITLFQAIDDYRRQYVPKPIKISERFHIKRGYVIACFICLLLLFIYFYK